MFRQKRSYRMSMLPRSSQSRAPPYRIVPYRTAPLSRKRGRSTSLVSSVTRWPAGASRDLPSPSARKCPRCGTCPCPPAAVGAWLGYLKGWQDCGRMDGRHAKGDKTTAGFDLSVRGYASEHLWRPSLPADYLVVFMFVPEAALSRGRQDRHVNNITSIRRLNNNKRKDLSTTTTHQQHIKRPINKKAPTSADENREYCRFINLSTCRASGGMGVDERHGKAHMELDGQKHTTHNAPRGGVCVSN